MVEAMKTHYELKPTGRYAQPLVFDWDITTGEVSGTGAQWILDAAQHGSTAAHPLPWQWTFSKTPLKSKTDMAAIVGYQHALPADLAPFYPQLSGNGAPDTSYTDTDGVVVIGNDALTF
jgi:hypothetical protein